MRVVDLDDNAHVFCGEDGEYQKWNIDPSVTVEAVPVEFIRERMNDVEKTFMIATGLMEAEHDHTYRRTGEYKLLAEYNALRDLISAWKEREE